MEKEGYKDWYFQLKKENDLLKVRVRKLASVSRMAKIFEKALDFACSGRVQLQLKGSCFDCPFFIDCEEKTRKECSLKFKRWYLKEARCIKK